MSTAYAVPECAPLYRENTGTECCLCIHGFTGSPGLYIPLADRLYDAGFSVSAPLLAGHGTVPEDLNGVSAEDWFTGASQELERLFSRYTTVHLIGLSMGGTIASWLAARYADDGRLGRLVLLAPGFGLKDKRYYAINYDTVENRMIPLPQRTPKGDGLDGTRYGYPAMPLKSVGVLISATDKAKAVLGNIRTPAMVLYTAADVTADPVECEEAIGKIQSLVSSKRFEHSEHNLLLGCDRLEVIDRTVNFIMNRE
jgi:carboxylesterase